MKNKKEKKLEISILPELLPIELTMERSVYSTFIMNFQTEYMVDRKQYLLDLNQHDKPDFDTKKNQVIIKVYIEKLNLENFKSFLNHQFPQKTIQVKNNIS